MKKTLYVLTFSGRKGSGKDTAASMALNTIEQRMQAETYRVAFADPIARKVCEIYQIDRDQYDYLKRTSLADTGTSEYPIEVDGRELVRGIGMLMRSYDDKQFVRHVHNSIETASDILGKSLDETAVVAVTDLRFENELDAMAFIDGAHVGGGVTIKWIPFFVERHNDYSDDHVSEQLTYADLLTASPRTAYIDNGLEAINVLRDHVVRALKECRVIPLDGIFEHITIPKR